MDLQQGQELELSIEKPAAGGRMLARYDGRVILVLGAVPGERVRARIDRVERQLAFASATQILDASSDRRDYGLDPLCGGCLYAHITYPRQLMLKAEVIREAFSRLGRISLDDRIPIEASPERGYRMRARFQVRDGRAGFYREGTHDLCDAAATGQLSESSVVAVQAAIAVLDREGCPVDSLELAENVAADRRIAHVTTARRGNLTNAALDAVVTQAGLAGCSGRAADGALRAAGVPAVDDPLPVLTAGRAATGTLERHAESFFQANRFLLPRLVCHVLDLVAPHGSVLDLYAGVGLFSVSLAASGRGDIHAVEGDRTSGSDLQRNAAGWRNALRVSVESVENYLRRRRGPTPHTIVVDPPRTGMSREALQGMLARGARQVIYVSCDPATMARDARRLIDGGYRIAAMRGFDLFPNTPHVEVSALFER